MKYNGRLIAKIGKQNVVCNVITSKNLRPVLEGK